ncbi:MAG: translation initiation factor [Bacteroidales bacterium]|nr:translation initiation factor [Bacteroidales bacterium]
MDWKDKLAALSALQQDEPDNQETNAQEEPKPQTPAKKQTLYIRYEKRNGKPATIVSEFQGTESELKELAKRLKSTLGIGGSAKDDEILLQGDVRAKVSEFLRKDGYKLKGEVR